jgi:hypothetical protein
MAGLHAEHDADTRERFLFVELHNMQDVAAATRNIGPSASATSPSTSAAAADTMSFEDMILFYKAVTAPYGFALDDVRREMAKLPVDDDAATKEHMLLAVMNSMQTDVAANPNVGPSAPPAPATSAGADSMSPADNALFLKAIIAPFYFDPHDVTREMAELPADDDAATREHILIAVLSSMQHAQLRGNTSPGGSAWRFAIDHPPLGHLLLLQHAGATPNVVPDAAPAEAQQRVQEQRAATQAPVSSQMSGM